MMDNIRTLASSFDNDRILVRKSDGRYRLGPGTLYDNVQHLLDKGIVAETAQPRLHTDSNFGVGMDE
jgi:hypothetical protein